ncbi:MAG: NAD(P)-dependent alcohol dehydrogenase [Spirochaetes bacterium]|nr:NAD(P)-dependent alcohol dehydrogenase [Spirochaetota bacterium]
MKAVVIVSGKTVEGLQLKEVAQPVPRANEVLIKVQASSVCRGDINLRRIPKIILVPLGLLFGFKPMKIPGVEYAGVVETVGGSVTRFKPGDAVFGTATGLAFGGNAEYLCVPEKRKLGVISLKPDTLSFEQAAVLPVGGMTALQNLKRLALRQGSRLLVYGASGSVGSYAIQLGRHYGAEVTAVCGTANQKLVADLGAQRVLDYTKAGWQAEAGQYDAVFDAVGKLSGADKKQLLAGGGKYSSIKAPTSEVQAELDFLAGLAAAGQLKPLIDRSYPLEQTAEAHAYVEGKHKRGNVVIEVA